MRTLQNIEVFPNDPYACVSCSFMFNESYTLQADEAVKLAYRVVIGNGEWSRLQIEEYVAACISTVIP